MCVNYSAVGYFCISRNQKIPHFHRKHFVVVLYYSPQITWQNYFSIFISLLWQQEKLDFIWFVLNLSSPCLLLGSLLSLPQRRPGHRLHLLQHLQHHRTKRQSPINSHRRSRLWWSPRQLRLLAPSSRGDKSSKRCLYGGRVESSSHHHRQWLWTKWRTIGCPTRGSCPRLLLLLISHRLWSSSDGPRGNAGSTRQGNV